MKKQLLGLIGTGIIAVSASADPITVMDNYIGGTGAWGGTNSNPGSNTHLLQGDVIGDEATFGIDSMTINQNGSEFDFSIKTNFVGNQDTYWGDYIGYGDLFLGSQWTPDGTAGTGYIEDEAFSTIWTYALVLGDNYELQLYKLNESSANTILQSNYFMEPTSNGYRKNQEVALNLDAEEGLIYNTGTFGTWSEDFANNLLKMNIDLSGTGLLDSNTLAFHWTMYCANDVIQGQADITPVSVPEPGLLSLLGLGFVGLWFARRRQQKLVA